MIIGVYGEVIIYLQLDFWQEPHMTHSPVHILVSPQRRTSLETLLIENNIPFHIKKDDIQR